MNDDDDGGSLEVRRKRLLFRAKRRGFKEVDLVFGTFAVAELSAMDASALDQFEALLHAPDQDVYQWLMDAKPVPDEFDTPLFARMKSLCRRQNPTWNV